MQRYEKIKNAENIKHIKKDIWKKNFLEAGNRSNITF